MQVSDVLISKYTTCAVCMVFRNYDFTYLVYAYHCIVSRYIHGYCVSKCGYVLNTLNTNAVLFSFYSTYRVGSAINAFIHYLD